jgi:carbon monoxide dehydrogenase subunit G
MAHAEHTTTIDRPRPEVFRFLADGENDPRWRPGVTDMTRVSGTGVGTRYRQGVKGPLGRRIPADIEITELRESELIAFRGLSGPVRPTGRYELTDDGAGTRVRFVLDAKPTGIGRLMAPMVQRSMTGEVGALDNLKRLLESG